MGNIEATKGKKKAIKVGLDIVVKEKERNKLLYTAAVCAVHTSVSLLWGW